MNPRGEGYGASVGLLPLDCNRLGVILESLRRRPVGGAGWSHGEDAARRLSCPKDWPDGMKVLLVELLLALEVSGGKGIYQ